MRRILALISIILAAAAFVLLSLIFLLRIKITIPIFMFIAAFMLLIIVKRMKSDEISAESAKPGETAFYDGNKTVSPVPPQNETQTATEPRSKPPDIK